MQAVWCPDQQSWHTSPHGDHPKSSHCSAGICVILHNQWVIILTLSTFLQHLGAGKTKADVPGFDLPNVEDLLWGQVKDQLTKNIRTPSHQIIVFSLENFIKKHLPVMCFEQQIKYEQTATQSNEQTVLRRFN